MALFWIAAGVLAGAAGLIVMLAARGAVAGGGDAALRLHRRQLDEIDALAERGLLNPVDKAAVRAEAGRRLLSADAVRAPPEQAGSRRSRMIAAGAALAAAFVALGLYFVIGAPGAPDQPYRGRVEDWRRSDPAALNGPELAAVLRQVVTTRRDDPIAYGFLGRAELAANDPYAAKTAFTRALALAPKRTDLLVGLAQSLQAEAAAAPTPEEGSGDHAAAEAALRRALILDPKAQDALFVLGRMEIEDGSREDGAGRWRALLATLSPDDRRRPALAAAIDRAAGGAPIEAPAEAAPDAAAVAGAEGGFIRGMVARLAARLEAAPDDPAGWARLVRAYGVLRDKPAQDAALAKARKLFAARPDALKPIETEAVAAPAG